MVAAGDYSEVGKNRSTPIESPQSSPVADAPGTPITLRAGSVSDRRTCNLWEQIMPEQGVSPEGGGALKEPGGPFAGPPPLAARPARPAGGPPAAVPAGEGREGHRRLREPLRPRPLGVALLATLQAPGSRQLHRRRR